MSASEVDVAVVPEAPTNPVEANAPEQIEQQPAIETQEPDVEMAEDDVSMDDKQEPEVRGNAIFLTGVNDMTSKDIEKFVKAYYERPFYMEWINDSSLNIAYDETEDAYNFLVDITDEKEFDSPDPIAPTQLRLTRPHPNPKFANQRIEARYATQADVKPSDARKRSEFYKKHGKPSRREDIVRFGTSRSTPMLYGLDGVDVLPSNAFTGDGDLFPDMARDEYEKDLITGELYKVKKSRGSSRGRSSMRESRSRADEPDLFAHKLLADRIGKKRSRGGRRRRRGANSGNDSNGNGNGHGNGNGESQEAPKEAAATSAYANMDY